MSSKLEKRKLPRGWRWTQLGDVCEESRCSIDGKSIEARELPYLSLENIESHSGKITLGSDRNSYTQGTSNCFRFECEHVLYGKLRPYLNKVALPNFSGRCTTELIPISPSSDIEREFLALILRRPETVNWAMAEITGSRMPRANMKRLMRLEIPLPPLSEQKRIVANLNKKMAAVEKARAATLERVEAIRALPAAFLREIFSFDDGKLPQGWRWVQLGDVCEIMVGKTPPREDKASFGGRHQWAKISDMNNPIIISTDETLSDKGAQICSGRMIEKGTLLYSFKLSIGKTAFTGTDMFTNEAIAGLTPKDALTLSKAFLRYALIFGDYGRFADVAAKGKTLNKKKLAQLGIPLPSLSEQKRIIADLNKKMTAIEKAREAAEAESEATHALPAAFLREAFGGAL